MGGRLAGRLAVVTGASRGIGRAISEAFVAEGASVVLVSRKQDALEAVAAELSDRGGVVWPRALHVGHVEEVGPWWQAIEAEVGTPDILVNNAGTNPYFGPMIATEAAAWDKTFEVNLKGPFEMTRQFVQRHLATRASSPASVVSITSVLGARAALFQGVYGMTKAALISMTQTLAHELGETGIRLNAIGPGVVQTRLAAALTESPEISEMLLARTALKRFADPSEIAQLAVFLASNESSYVTGQTFYVDAGYLTS